MQPQSIKLLNGGEIVISPRIDHAMVLVEVRHNQPTFGPHPLVQPLTLEELDQLVPALSAAWEHLKGLNPAPFDHSLPVAAPPPSPKTSKRKARRT